MKSYINPKIITWARKRAGLTIEDLAKKMKRDPGEIKLWESGRKGPSYACLEQLAYTYLKIPLAVFFFPQPPDVDDPVKKFRRLPSDELERFSPDTYRKIYLAQGYQDSLEVLMMDTVRERRVFRDISPEHLKPAVLAAKTRTYLG
ncbi:MAG: helix-turn-helix transcriptional regulator, partial [Candidatus Zixiibacteriota bacterium]